MAVIDEKIAAAASAVVAKKLPDAYGGGLVGCSRGIFAITAKASAVATKKLSDCHSGGMVGHSRGIFAITVVARLTPAVLMAVRLPMQRL